MVEVVKGKAEEKEVLTIEEMRAKFAKIEQDNIQKAQSEIQAICEKYGVQLQAAAVIPATQIQIVPKR